MLRTWISIRSTTELVKVRSLSNGSAHISLFQGQLTLRKLKLKKGALDKFQLPVDVLEGAGTMSILQLWSEGFQATWESLRFPFIG